MKLSIISKNTNILFKSTSTPTLTDHIYCSYQAISQRRYKDNVTWYFKEYPIAFQIAPRVFEIYNSKLICYLPRMKIKE